MSDRESYHWNIEDPHKHTNIPRFIFKMFMAVVCTYMVMWTIHVFIHHVHYHEYYRHRKKMCEEINNNIWHPEKGGWCERTPLVIREARYVWHSPT